MKSAANARPGQVLIEKYLQPLGLSQNELARTMHVSPRRINEIVLGKRPVTADTTLRLARALNTSPHLWLDLQSDYDFDRARRKLGARLDKILPVCPQRFSVDRSATETRDHIPRPRNRLRPISNSDISAKIRLYFIVGA